MRKLRSRKTPRSSGIVGASPSRCSRTEAPAPAGCTPCETWASWSGSPRRIRLRAARPHRERVRQGDLPGLVDDEIVERAVEPRRGRRARRSRRRAGCRRRRAFEGRVVVVVLDELAVVLGLRIPSVDFLSPLKRTPVGPGDLLDLGEQVVDGLVALRRDADAPAVRQQVHDDAGARPRLAGAGRALDEEVAPVEPERQRLHLVQIGGLHRRARGEPADARAAPGRGWPGAPGSGHRRPGSTPPRAAPRRAGSGSRRGRPRRSPRAGDSRRPSGPAPGAGCRRFRSYRRSRGSPRRACRSPDHGPEDRAGACGPGGGR